MLGVVVIVLVLGVIALVASWYLNDRAAIEAMEKDLSGLEIDGLQWTGQHGHRWCGSSKRGNHPASAWRIYAVADDADRSSVLAGIDRYLHGLDYQPLSRVSSSTSRRFVVVGAPGSAETARELRVTVSEDC